MKFTYLLLSIIPAVLVSSCSSTTAYHDHASKKTVVNSGSVIARNSLARAEVTTSDGTRIVLERVNNDSEKVADIYGLVKGAEIASDTTLGLGAQHVSVENTKTIGEVRKHAAEQGTKQFLAGEKTKQFLIKNPPAVRFFRASQPTRSELMKLRREMFRREDEAVFYSVLP